MLLYEEFKRYCKYLSDDIRINIIKNNVEKIKNNKKYNINKPDYNKLLDDWNGYDDQIYIQNINNNEIIYYEGWVKACWDAAYLKDEYKKLSKKEILNIYGKTRLNDIINILNYKLINYEFFYFSDIHQGYIMKIHIKFN